MSDISQDFRLADILGIIQAISGRSIEKIYLKEIYLFSFLPRLVIQSFQLHPATLGLAA